MHELPSPAQAGARHARLHEAIARASRYLPAQAPIRTFIHHNTLHAFEELPFEEAVLAAAELYGTEPYLSEAAFAAHLASGRILPADLDAVLAAEAAPEDDLPLYPGGPTRRRFRRARLGHLFERPRGAALAWALTEGGLLSRVRPSVEPEARSRLLEGGPDGDEAAALAGLWARLLPHAPAPEPEPTPRRERDRLLASTGLDADDLVHPLLIRLCAAFVDQGIAYWPMPGREEGLLAAFRRLYAAPAPAPAPWLRELPALLRRHAEADLGAEETIAEALSALGVPEGEQAETIEATLLALKGWAGMIRTLEEKPHSAPVEAPPARLADFLAVRLTLDSLAARHLRRAPRVEPAPAPGSDLGPVHEAFVMAQVLGLPPAGLGPEAAGALVEAARRFPEAERRRLLHLAYERRHRVGLLDGLLNHARLGGAPTPEAPAAQVICCMDEREGSFRRHLEETFPAVETFGMAGHFGIAMAYRGLEDVLPTAMCPVSVTPRHLVVEEPLTPEDAERAQAARRRLGLFERATDTGSRTFVRGGLLAASLGVLAGVPLVGRALFPRTTEKLVSRLRSRAVGHVRTRLRVERPAGHEAPDAHGLLPGYAVAEMADVVEQALRALGLVRRFAPIVAIVGHGSSSLNNPHESAYNCGAAGGGPGGPNARAFAAMANHPGVRALLAGRGLPIPPGTWFVGGYHNTADETVACYDLDLVPDALRAPLAALRSAFERARRLDAHERVRRFEDAPAEVDPDTALAIAETHAADLGQPRPEYGHATNAAAVVGRRARTRGLYMDRRTFLISYDPETDPDHRILGGLLQAAVPVAAGINLEYFFSCVDPAGYGCGTKLPHNITGLVGVMDGHGSDLRTGLTWQMVELHEPVRLLMVVEAEPEALPPLLAASPEVSRLVLNGWVQLVAWSPATGRMHRFARGRFVPYEAESAHLPVVPRSAAHYHGRRGHLPSARVEAPGEKPSPR